MIARILLIHAYINGNVIKYVDGFVNYNVTKQILSPGTKIMSGAIVRRLDEIKKQGGINSREVAQLLDTTPETVSRWTTGKAQPQPERLNKLLILEWLIGELSDFYHPEEARLWLFAPHKLLSGESPANKIKIGMTNDVLAIIDQLKTGAYV